MINDENCTDKLSRVSGVCRLGESGTAANENNTYARLPFTKKECLQLEFTRHPGVVFGHAF